MDSTQRTRPRTGGSQVGLVVFIIMTVVFAVLSYWMFANWRLELDLKKKAETDKKTAETLQKKAADKAVAFETVTGVDSPDALAEFIANALKAAEAEGFGSGAQPTAKDALTTSLYAMNQQKIALDSLNTSLATEQSERKNLDGQIKASDEQNKKSLAEISAELQQVQKTMEDEKARLQAEIEKEIAVRETLRDQYYHAQDEWNAAKVKYALHILELQTKLRELSGEGTVLAEASGRITSIDLRNALVSVDIGSSAGVKPGMRFVAFAKNAKGQPLKKGVVEIVRVADRTSVARIIAQEADMKIGRDDSVYNLAGPKQKLFVFAGTPKEYTVAQWTNYIRVNGGEMMDEVRQGDKVADYLVLCTFDETKDTKAIQQINDAKDYGLVMMKESQLKSDMGLK
jgi:hypothetical protein